MGFRSKQPKLSHTDLDWLEQILEDLNDGQIAKAKRAVEFKIEKAKMKSKPEGTVIEANTDCPDCFGAGFKPTGPQRNAPVMKCDHKGLQPILKAETGGIDIPF